MKVTDLNQIRDEAKTQLEDGEWLILNYVQLDVAALMVTNIYLMADQVSGFGQDIRRSISVISNNSRISTIADGTASYYKHDGVICAYEDLEGDIGEILMVLEASIQRMITFQ